MASVFTHPVVVLGLYAAMPAARPAGRVLAAGMLLSLLPDVDVIGFAYGIRYGDLLGHRGLSHSLAVAALLALLLAPPLADTRPERPRVALFLFLAAASHGLLDSFTDGGLGVALLAPFSEQRFFAPWRPIAVSPIGVRAFFGEWGVRVLDSEIRWVWLPTLALVAAVSGWRRWRARDD